MPSAFLADAIMVAHFAFVLFVVLGQALILLGVARRWRWVRNPWFRVAHLAAIGVVALEAVVGVACPLTVWESALRQHAGQSVSGESFVGRLVHAVMFWDGCTEQQLSLLHIGFGLLVLATFVLAPPAFRKDASAKRR
jgi:hypothetical protein